MRMGIGLGIGINRSNYAQGIFNAYSARVVVDGGVTEGGSCVDAASTLLQSASLLLVPSGYKGGKLYSQIPTNGNGDLTWTRASDAFRTDASGLIQRVPWNFASYSEDFSNAAWSLDGVTISANQIASPTGTTTADLMTSNGTGQQRIFQTYTVVSGSQYTISIYVKQGTTSNIQIVMPYVGAGPTFTFSTATFNTVSGWTSSVQTLANGWYRISATQTATSTNAGFQLVLPSNGSSVYLWGAQFDQNSTAQTYLPTTDRLNFPRLSYMYASCPSVLLEPQRTNLLPNQLSYNTSTGASYNTSITDSPIIGINSARVTKNEASGTVRYGNQSCANSALTGSTTYTISAYFKYDGYDFQTSMEYNNSLNFGGTSWSQPINIASTGITLGSSTSCTGSIQNVGNGWYRVSVTITTGAVIGGLTPVTYLMRLPSTLSTGQGFLHAVPQFEQGAYSTTVIPTSGATATRVADSAIKTGISSLIGQTEGVIYCDVYLDIRQSYTYFAIAPNIGSASTYIGIGFLPTSITYEVVNSGAVQAGITFTNSSTGRFKIAGAYKANDFVLYINGTQIGTDTSGTVPTCSEIGLFQYNQNQPMRYNQIALFNTRLTNAELATLTTL